jgi:bifunctional non-homologous end joining protein LigD
MSSWGDGVLARDRRRPDGFIKPCLLSTATSIPTGPEWQFEVKPDGYRMIVHIDQGRVRMWSRNGLDWTKAFPGIVAGLENLHRSAVIDGEVVCQREDVSSDFHALKGPEGCARAVLWAFDLLMLDGEDVRSLPLQVRRERLAKLITDSKPEGVALSEHPDGNGQALFDAACRLGPEGIVAKREGSRYASGRTRHWFKIKNPNSERVP